MLFSKWFKNVEVKFGVLNFQYIHENPSPSLFKIFRANDYSGNATKISKKKLKMPKAEINKENKVSKFFYFSVVKLNGKN